MGRTVQGPRDSLALLSHPAVRRHLAGLPRPVHLLLYQSYPELEALSRSEGWASYGQPGGPSSARGGSGLLSRDRPPSWAPRHSGDHGLPEQVPGAGVRKMGPGRGTPAGRSATGCPSGRRPVHLLRGDRGPISGDPGPGPARVVAGPPGEARLRHEANGRGSGQHGRLHHAFWGAPLPPPASDHRSSLDHRGLIKRGLRRPLLGRGPLARGGGATGRGTDPGRGPGPRGHGLPRHLRAGPAGGFKGGRGDPRGAEPPSHRGISRFDTAPGGAGRDSSRDRPCPGLPGARGPASGGLGAGRCPGPGSGEPCDPVSRGGDRGQGVVRSSFPGRASMPGKARRGG